MKTNLNKSIIYVDENLTKTHKQYIHKIHKPSSQQAETKGKPGGAQNSTQSARTSKHNLCHKHL